MVPPTEQSETPSSTTLHEESKRTTLEHAVANEERLLAPTLPQLRFVFLAIGVSLGLFLSMLDASIVATSLFTIAVEFEDVAGINWVALAYTLTYLGCAVLFALLSDVLGRRAAFAAAYVVFVAFSLACGFARNMAQLIAFRAVQGIGGSGLYSVSMIILPELTPDHQKKYIAAIVAVVLAAAGVLGPVLGGILTQYTSWRWVFWINGPVGLVSIVIFLATWPNEKYLPAIELISWKEVDFVGALLLIAAAVLIVFPFQNTSSSQEWSSAVFIGPLVAGVISLLALFAWQAFIDRQLARRKKKYFTAAALPLALLRSRAYASAVLHTTLTGFPYLLSIYAFPLYFQVVYGQSPLNAGLMLLPMLAASALGTMVAGAVNSPGKGVASGDDGGDGGDKTTKRKGERANRLFETLAASCLFMLLGCALETTAEAKPDGAVEPRVLGFLVFIGLGFGMSAAGSTMLAAMEAPMCEHASAQGIIAQVRILGGSLGIAASSAILGSTTRDVLGAPVYPEVLAHMASGLGADGLSADQWGRVRQAYADALREEMIVSCAVLAAALLVTLGVYRRGRVSMDEMMRQRYREEAERRRQVVAAEEAM